MAILMCSKTELVVVCGAEKYEVIPLEKPKWLGTVDDQFHIGPTHAIFIGRGSDYHRAVMVFKNRFVEKDELYEEDILEITDKYPSVALVMLCSNDARHVWHKPEGDIQQRCTVTENLVLETTKPGYFNCECPPDGVINSRISHLKETIRTHSPDNVGPSGCHYEEL